MGPSGSFFYFRLEVQKSGQNIHVSGFPDAKVALISVELKIPGIFFVVISADKIGNERDVTYETEKQNTYKMDFIHTKPLGALSDGSKNGS